MQIKRLSPAGCEELYHTALPRDFPAAECKPFAEIRRLLEAGVYEPLLLTDDAGARLAYAWQVVLPGQRTALLDYFAVRCDLRGSGVGTAALQLIRDYYALRVQDLLLECEHPAEAPDPAVARRRIGFYLRAGACLVRAHGTGVPVRSVTFGRVQDYAVHDINNMGAAMMPAAASTLLRYFAATGARPQDFDAIFTGDLGEVGSALLREQMAREGLPLDNHRDCGCLLYDTQGQDVQAGGSGAGCSAAVLCCKILPMLAAGQLRRVLFLATGALMSQTTFLQGESIPGIAHCVELGGAV